MNREANSQQQLNLTALQRIDNKIVEVLGTSTHVAVYKFDEQSQQWHRREVEGSLFIVRRVEEPYERLVVLNRLSTKNLVEDVNEKLLIKCQGPYLIYKNNTESINGIWFYETSEQERLFNQLKEIQKQLSLPRAPPPVIHQQPPQLQQQPMPQPPPQMMQHIMMQPMMQAMMQQQMPHPMPQQPMPQQPMPQPIPVQPLVQPQMFQQQQQHQQMPTTQTPPPQRTTPPPSKESSDILAKLMSSVALKPPGLHVPTDHVPSPTATHAGISVSTLESEHHQHQHHQHHHHHATQPNNAPLQAATTASLTKDQLREVLKRLVNDDQFITQVYNSYVSASK
ncbi:hypothetical protein SAMD00019534_122530 [Acytostelium subglobosum LB1]|uniref:hypothetical protein n=1 Tax=Acytostelium subglobosum LB1 TaxID=1410327 RepID=UPI000644D138|nr:hypothetical protein SAMD00019534_122530 [Acytostelium subglobosum LB1]GAM29077.1 hypothetical protein SAMD00019534_122530 [Acytostelium subglobosum LB1]|eukprot:XP_012747922.1 hypothetical protein SAMD00019534_122530 [Acytostelium subglobosum LB1]